MKREIESHLKGIVSDRFIELWWSLRLKGLNGRTPDELYSSDPEALYEYVKGYSVDD